jgi:hypothetical protein
MKRQLKFSLWMLPLLGFVLGYACAYVSFHGLLEVWHLVGKPEEKVVHILGVKEARHLLVATETGQIFSFRFADAGGATRSLPFMWTREDHDSSEPVPPIRYYGADFFTLPPRFQVVQLFQMEYIFKIEGKGAVKFALDADGNVWMWKHQIAGLTGLVFYFYPVIGFIAGLFAVFLSKGIQRLRANDRFRSGLVGRQKTTFHFLYRKRSD